MAPSSTESIDDARSADERYFELYTILESVESFSEALRNEHITFAATVGDLVGIEPGALREANGDVLNEVMTRLRDRPDWVLRLLTASDPGSHATQLERLSDALDGVPDRSKPDNTAALGRAADQLSARFEALTGEKLALDVDRLAQRGRRVFVQLLHSSAQIPSFAELFAKWPRVSAATPSAPGARKEHPAAAPPAARNEALAPRAGATSTTGATELELRQARIDALLECCPTPGSSAASHGPTFPEDLTRREDIYYDFSIVIPVDGAEEPGDKDLHRAQEKQLLETSTAAFRALLSVARSVIETLDLAKMRDTFGPTLVNDIETFLETAEQHVLDDRSWLREGLRRVAREFAAALRLAARMRLHVAPGQSDLMKQAQALATRLTTAVTNYAFTHLSVARLPKQLGTKDHGETAGLDLPVAEHDPEEGRVLWHTAVKPLPDTGWAPFGPDFAASMQRWYNWNYRWAELPQLREYLDGMSDKLTEIDTLKDLCSESATVLVSLNTKLATFSLGDAEYRRKVEALLGGITNDAAYALATILDEIAEILPIPLGRRLPYAKRLAIQVVYRQTWRPVGYSRGKLVGYKTLLPGESQQIKRRTFVKTTSETNTAEDFAASRQNDFANTVRETSDVLRETGDKFDFKASASGHVDFAVAGAEVRAETGVALAGTSKNVRNSVTEAVTKGSVAYSNKRELKVRELVEREVTDESVNTITNSNQEITANYFYYQLFRNYNVSTVLYDARPVILVARDYPTPAQIDEVWLGKHLHDLLFALPPQLAADASATINGLEAIGRRLIRARSAAARAQTEYELLRDTMLPNVANVGAAPGALDDRQREALSRAAEAAQEARTGFDTVESEYHETSARMSRVVGHVRENILMYMHRIWQAGSDVDRQRALRDETWMGKPLDRATRGLNRLGFLGEEEIYEYTDKSGLVLQVLMELMISGAQVMGLGDGTPLKEQLIRRVMTERDCNRADAIAYIAATFVVTDEDPNGATDIPRTVQLAQDALAVEAMPGTQPLLEGFKLAHRALDLQRACLENQHLAARIVDRPWMNPKSVDDYSVERGDGVMPPAAP